MKKIIIISLIVIFGAYKYYIYKLKKAFDIQLVGLNDIQISLEKNEVVVNLDIIIQNKLLPDLVINKVDLDIWINDNYLGHLSSNEPVKSQNGQIVLHGTFISNDLGLTAALMLEKEKFVQIAGVIKLIEPLSLSFKINNYGQF